MKQIFNRAPRSLASVALCAALMASLLGCDASSRLKLSDLPGEPVSSLRGEVRDNSNVIVQDLSVIVDLEPSYTSEDINSDRWIVIAACGDDELVARASEIQLGVIPRESLNATIEEEIERGEFDSSISCSGQ